MDVHPPRGNWRGWNVELLVRLSVPIKIQRRWEAELDALTEGDAIEYAIKLLPVFTLESAGYTITYPIAAGAKEQKPLFWTPAAVKEGHL